MAEIARWAGHTFEVSPRLIRSLNTLIVKAGIETDDMEAGGQRYVARQAGKAAELSFSIPLNGFMGVDVRTEAMAFIDEARKGTADYFYIGGSKLMTCQLMLTEASVSETELGAGGMWTACTVKLTMKQSSKFDGEEGEGHKVENGSSTGYAETDEEKGTSGNKKSLNVQKNLKSLTSLTDFLAKGASLAAKNIKTSSAAAEINRLTQNRKNAAKKSAATKKKNNGKGSGAVVLDR